MKKELSKSLIVLLAVLATAGWWQFAHAQQNLNLDNVEIQVLPVQGNVYMLVGAGGNSTVQIGRQGVVLVDTQFAQLSNKILATIGKLNEAQKQRQFGQELVRGVLPVNPIGEGKIRYIINTHSHGDHTGGNENLRKAGITITGANVTREIADARAGALIIAHENVLSRMSAPTGQQSPTPPAAWPTDTFFGRSKEIYFNTEPIEVIHVPAAHTDGDSVVFFRRSDVVTTGDLFVTTSYPVIDLQRGGSIQGILDGLNLILDLVIPAHEQEGGTLVIPGHGRICDEADVVEYRDMVTIIRDRIRNMKNKGMTLEQVKAAKPTRDYDPLYGATTGSWTTDMFVEAVYRTLGPKQ